MKITVLMENTAPSHLICEHGLSFHIEYQGHSYLLDAGASGDFVKNAHTLGIDLAGVERAALSHGHYDHADGLSAFFEVNSTASVLARPAITTPYFSSSVMEDASFIGVSPALLKCWGHRFDLADGPRPLAPGLWLIPDGVAHEQSLVAETDHGLVVLNSCCHAGPGYIIKALQNHFPSQHIGALVGGFHLMGKTGVDSLGVAPGIVKNLAHWLTAELGVAHLYTGHCTGVPAFSFLQEVAGDRVHPLSTGDVLTF